MSTVGKVRELFSGQYASCEFYKPVGEAELWSANGLRRIEGAVPENAEVIDYRLFDEDEYNLIFWMPIGEHVSFEGTFGDKTAGILCIVLQKSGQFVFRRRVRIEKKSIVLYIPADSMEEAERKADAAVVLGIWHKYLDLSNPHNKRIFQGREKYYTWKGRYPG